MSTIRTEITNKVIRYLERKMPPWRRPWGAVNLAPQPAKVDTNIGLPTNCVTGKTYRGINVLLLNMTAQSRDYGARWWGTAKQWAKLGGKIKQAPGHILESDWGTTVYVFLPPRGNRFRGLLKRYKVYHLDQVSGEFDGWKPGRNLTDPQYELANRVVAATGAEIEYGGDRAIYYRPDPIELWPKHTGGDYIKCPHEVQFLAPHYFHGTRFHELCHWAEVRLGWRGSYEMGELVAELGGMFLAERVQIPPNDSWDNHAAYLGSWVEAMKADSSAIFLASAQASLTADHILSYYEGTYRLQVVGLTKETCR